MTSDLTIYRSTVKVECMDLSIGRGDWGRTYTYITYTLYTKMSHHNSELMKLLSLYYSRPPTFY